MEKNIKTTQSTAKAQTKVAQAKEAKLKEVNVSTENPITEQKIDIEAEIAKKVAEELAKIKLAQVKEQSEAEEKVIEKENILNMDTYTTVRNLCNWDLHFSLKDGVSTGAEDRMIKTESTLDILNRDIVSLCNNSNIFFIGEGQGSHARVYIENPELRVRVGFDSKDGTRKQSILDKEKLDYIFSLELQRDFEKAINEEVIAFHEKDIIINYARKIRVNDYEKINFLEVYCNRKFRID